MEFQIKALDNVFRVKKMNAIEALALRTCTDVDDFDKTTKTFSTILEHLEVKCGEQWLPVKEKNANVYYPAGLEDNVDACNELIDAFLNQYFWPLFRKSDASKN